MARKWEGSKEDKKVDARAAKKSGVSLKKWEGSAADEKIDRRGQAKFDKKKK